tara:strand:+ start:1040 stop:2134 length:1095 start_codon:yes stop_codon:yes gene_type:complete
MASKKYAYYNKANKIGLVEQSATTSSGRMAVAHCTLGGYTTKDTCEAAGGQWIPGSSGNTDSYGEYTSPVESISHGLEIEYTYAPIYHNATNDRLQNNKFYINGWGVIDGYLSFFRGHKSTVANWDVSPYTSVGDNDYILVEGSQRWNGVHKVQSAASSGVKTYTKVNQNWTGVTGSSNIDVHGDSGGKALISANDASHIWLNAKFSAGDYIWIAGSGSAKNNGFWEIDSVATDSSVESTSGIYVGKRYYCYEGENTLSTEGIETTADTDGDVNESLSIYKAERDFCTIKTDITAMEDESFELDLTHYQSLAIVSYLQSKLAESVGEFEMKEYFMREFRKQVEKAASSRKYGPYRVQGFGMTRK